MDLINEDVVISGVGGYFPKSANIEEFQNNLLLKKDLLGSRWKEGERDVTNKIGTIPINFFDNAYFGINREQSIHLSPMTRLCMERTFEALVDAGINPNEIKGKNVAVYMSCGVCETDEQGNDSLFELSGYNVTGTSKSMMSARISYWLNLNGPSISFYSNWMAGMDAIQLAYENIKAGLIEAAIVGTASILRRSNMQWLHNEMHLLSPDGTTRPFDAEAQGYGRSDGTVVFYIQKASNAKRIYASIVNVATEFNGDGEGDLLNIHEPNMINFLKDFYATSSIKPEEVDFVETYGCGIKKFDESELRSLDEIYCQNRNKPLLISSVKSNTGHAEVSAVMFSIVKVLIAMEQGIIPANLHFKNPNPNIKNLLNQRIEIITENREWSPKYAAVNALNILPSYGHILLKANQKVKVLTPVGIPRLVVASTRNEAGIKDILEMAQNKCQDFEYYQMMNGIFDNPILGHLYRGFTILDSSRSTQEFTFHQGLKRTVWFVYSGMGSQWNGMIGDLMKLPIFAASIHKCHQVLIPKGIDLLNILSTKDKTIFNNILNSFVGIAAMQIALTDVLKAIGIVPDGIIGHSVGELGCAYADECLTSEQMILAAYSRGRASIESNLISGMMAAVGVGYHTIRNKLPPTIEVACHNGPDSSTLSGPKEDMEKFVAELQDQGIFARLVNVSNIAFHSRYIKPAAPVLLKYLKEYIPEKVRRSSKWISTSNREENWDTEMAQYSSPEYHTNNLLSSVYFEEGLKYIPRDAILIEIAPHGLLQAILKRSLKANCINISVTQRGCNSGLEFLLEAFGKMYLAGINLSIGKLYPKLKYPVSRGTYSLAPITYWNHLDDWQTGYENIMRHTSASVIDKEISLDGKDFHEFVGHQVDDDIIVPISIYLSTINQIMDFVKNNRKQIIFEDVHIRKILTISRTGSTTIHASLQVGSGEFEIMANDEIIITGKIAIPQDKHVDYSVQTGNSLNSITVNASDVYSEFLHRGYQYSGSFKAIKNITFTDQGSSAAIEWNNQWTFLLEAIIQQELLHAGEKYQNIQFPNYIKQIDIKQDLLPSEKMDLTINYEYSTNIATTKGLTVIGLRTTTLSKKKKDSFIEFWKYVPLMKSVLSDMEVLVYTALQLLVSNFYQLTPATKLTVIEVQSKESLSECIRNVSNLYLNTNISVTAVNDPKEIIQHTNHPSLVIFNDFINKELLKQFNESHQLLILTKNNQAIGSNSDFVSIAEFSCHDNQYILLKWANIADVLTVTAKDNILDSKDLKNKSRSWVSDIRDALEISKRNNKRIYFISSLIPVEGIIAFMQELSAQFHSKQLRFLFILEKQISIDLESVYKQDLILSVIKKNKLHAYLSFPLEWKAKFSSIPPADPIMINRNIHYVGVNWDLETSNPTIKANERIYSRVFDYSGLNSKCLNIMGLAEFSEESGKLIPDSILKWDVPTTMTLEECATIPYAYTAAYYVLFIKAKLNSKDNVLVHGGCSPVGQAIIHTALASGCPVCTTVASDAESKCLKRIFGNQLKDSQIMNLANFNFQPAFLQATKSRGAQVVINCFSNNLLQSTLKCTGSFGKFIHLGHLSVENYTSIGMRCFNESIAFHVVNLNKITQKTHDIKSKLQQLIQNGISQDKIKPLKGHIYELENIPQLIYSPKEANGSKKVIIDTHSNFTQSKLGINKHRYIRGIKNSYLLCGGNSEHCLQLVEWLTFNGAKYITISTSQQYIYPNIKRRLDLLTVNFECYITYYYNNNVYSRKEIEELILKVTNSGPIHGVFLLPSNNKSEADDTQLMQYMDDSLRVISPNTILVNLSSSAAGLCQARSNAGFPCCNIQYENDIEFSDIILDLDNILRRGIKNAWIKNNLTNNKKEVSTELHQTNLAQMLPASPETLISEIVNSPKEPEFIRLITDSPLEIRELTPLFIIPGLKAMSEMEQLGNQLSIPTFCARLPATSMNLKELAEKYVELIREIWPKGPYNLMGISWGGVLATEIANLLDRKYQSIIYIYYIDSAPYSIKSIISQLGNEADELEINLLKEIFKSEDLENLRLVQGWNERIDTILRSYPQKTLDSDSFLRGISILKQRLMDAKMYQPDGNLINATVHLIRSSDYDRLDNCGLSQYYEQKPQIFLTTGNLLSNLGSKEAAEYINETFQIE